MIREARLFLQLTRPAVLLLLALFAAIGATSSGAATQTATVAEIYFVVATFLVFSVAANDLADFAVDRVNLPADRRRPLVAGTARQRDMVLLALVSAAASLAVAAMVNVAVLLTTACGIAISAAYSLPPSRLSARGTVASLVLPACYVATPFLIGFYAGRSSLRPHDLLLLVALYIGFIGRILLKDFRDVRGDALFGKRTFLVRHGRRTTCLLSATLWITGAVLLICTGGWQDASALTYAGQAVAVTVLIAALSADRGPRRDEILISTIAILGRGLLLTVLARNQLTAAQWTTAASAAMLLAVAAITAGQAWWIYQHGPRMSTLVLPMTPAAAERPVSASAR
jgi:4-hydroxybenzoate polyprenyltransferase